MLIYSKAREQRLEGAEALLQIEIAGGLWCDRRPKVRHLVIYLWLSPSSSPALGPGSGASPKSAGSQRREETRHGTLLLAKPRPQPPRPTQLHTNTLGY